MTGMMRRMAIIAAHHWRNVISGVGSVFARSHTIAAGADDTRAIAGRMISAVTMWSRMVSLSFGLTIVTSRGWIVCFSRCVSGGFIRFFDSCICVFDESFRVA